MEDDYDQEDVARPLLSPTSINQNPDDYERTEGSKQEQPKVGLISSVFPLTNTIIGAGTLSLPYAFANSGIGFGAFLLVAAALLCLYSAHLLIITGQYSKGIFYKDLAVAAYGKWGKRGVEFMLVLLCWGSMVAYLVVAINLLPRVVDVIFDTDGAWYWSPKFLLGFLVVLVMLPLSMQKHMQSLRYSSIVSLMSITYLVGLVVIKSILDLSNGKSSVHEVKAINLGESMFNAFPILSMAFTFHFNIASVQTELKNPSPARIQKVCNIAVGISCIFYSIVGTFGYLDFGSDTESDILVNYNKHEVPVVIANAALVVVVCMAFPLLNFPCRGNLTTLFFNNSESKVLHVGLTVGAVLSSYGVAILGLPLGFIFGLVGSVVAIPLVFIFPSAYYIKLGPDPLRSSPKKKMALGLLIIGVVLCVLCTFTVIDSNF